MGLYFIAAGSSSKNREKSLEKGFNSDQIENFLNDDDIERLRNCYPNGNGIFVWGANEGSTFNQLKNVPKGDFVVDVKNRLIVQIFKFCFFIDTGNDTRLQDYIGWDSEKPVDEKRLYRYVFFLKDPQNPGRDQKEKAYFQSAFNQLGNSQWLVGQKWFSNSEVREALIRKKVNSIEELLGVLRVSSMDKDTNYVSPLEKIRSRNRNLPVQDEPFQFIAPNWLMPIIEQVKLLHVQIDHKERDHEDIVKELFRVLGYKPTEEIKFQRGRIDILIAVENRPLITVEVKRDWSLSEQNSDYVRQAFNYSHEVGTRFVVVTNGDKFLIYDRTRGFRSDEMLLANFELTKLDDKGLQSLESLKRSNLQE